VLCGIGVKPTNIKLYNQRDSNEQVVINLFHFFSHYKSSPFHTIIRIHLILLSYRILVILPSQFSSMGQMLMLMFMTIKHIE